MQLKAAFFRVAYSAACRRGCSLCNASGTCSVRQGLWAQNTGNFNDSTHFVAMCVCVFLCLSFFLPGLGVAHDSQALGPPDRQSVYFLSVSPSLSLHPKGLAAPTHESVIYIYMYMYVYV